MFRLRLFTFRGHDTVWLSGRSVDFAGLIEALDRITAARLARADLAAFVQLEDPDQVHLTLVRPAEGRGASRYAWPCIGDDRERERLARLWRGEVADDFVALDPAPTLLLVERWEES